MVPKRGKRRFQRSSFSLIFLNSFILVAILFFTLLTLTFFTSVLDYQKVRLLIPFLGLSGKEGLQIQGNVIDQKAGGSDLVQQSLTSSVAEEPLTLTPRRLGTHNVPESSGVVASRQYPSVYWMHGDSVQAASIIAVNASGATIKAFNVLGSNNIDWEDIALDENNNIWIADIGNNPNPDPTGPIPRGTLVLYKVPEPDPYGAGTQTQNAVAYRFQYPDERHDAEGMFIWQNVPYVVEKRTNLTNRARIYKFPEPLNSSSIVTLQLFAEFTNNGNRITGADISRDGERLALINDGADYHWIIKRNSSSTTIADFFNAPSRQWRIQFNNNQGEAIGFVNGKYDFVVASETGDFWGIDRSQYDPLLEFIFAAGGDHGSNSNTNASLDVLNRSGASFYLALGDMSYGVVGQESIWCDLVKSHLNATYPFELVSGNHEEDGGPNGRIMSFAGCLPDRLSASGIYGAEYFFDYLNLTRIIMISPGLTVGGVSYTYFSGNSHYTWLSNVIDTARAQGIPWVIVGMHKNCITSATKSCEIGADLLNLLLNKKVDLILQGHDHVYERSKQLTCATSGSYLPSCVADDGSDGIYTQGAGSVLVITGVFGQSLYAINTGDSEAGYFAKWMGSNINPTYGFTRFFVNQSEISVDFLRSIGGTFTDSFRIVNASLVTSPLRLQAFHRNGQTFLTWNEAGNYFPENLNFSQYDNIRNANPGIGYRIYRYIAPINSSNLNQATRIAEVGVGTGYNFYLYGKESSDSWGSRAGQDIPRFVIQEGIGGWGSGELPLNTGLYVHTTAESSGNFYYAITLVNNSLENRTDFSSLQSPVSEVYDQNWKPILQNRSFVNETWYTGLPSVRAYYYAGDQHFFTRWEIPQLTDLASRPNNYRVVIPYNVAPPYKVDMNLHCWGSSLVSCNKLVFYSDGIYLTSTDYPPQSWWTGWNENLSFTSSQNQWTGINRYYTMHRMISFIDWMKTQWSIDNNRIMCSGWSMGGSGGKMFCLRYGNYFNYINSWAGVGVAKSSPLFNESFIGLFGSISRGILDENGFNSWDDLNMSWWLRTYPLQETPFISFSNAKNDGGIGWEQAVEFYQALRDTKRPFTFRWSQEGHENHALDMSLIELSDYAGANRIDFQKNRAIPAFTRFSLDNNPGNGDPANGDSVGYINAYQRWDPNTIVDQLNHFEIELWMNSSINLTGTMDITLRSLQFFSVSPGEFFSWTLYQGVTLVQQGTSVADSLGLVSVLGIVLVNNTKRKLVVTTGGGSSTPTINSVSGMVSHGQNIVIGGSGFGTKTTAAPVVWDDASGASPQQTWDFILPTTNELQYRPAYRTPAQVTNASGAIIGVPLPHNHISRYFSGAHYINLGSGGYYSSSNVVAGMNNRQGQTNSYISYYVRISPDWFFTDMGGIGGNDHNFKEYQYDAGNGYFGGSQKNSYFGYFNPDQLQATWGVNYIEGMNVSIFSVNTTLDTWYPQYNTVFSTAPIPNIRDDWRKVEFLLIHNSASGYHKIYHDNVLNMEVYLDDDGLDSSIPPERSETVIGGFARESGNSTKSQSLSNNWRYYADVYYDSSFSRVMLANDVNYDLATIIEPQVPSAWSDGSVTVKVNLGRLPDTGTAYLFIFNSSNGRNVNGYAVTVSGSVPDTTPPTIPTGLTATPFSSSQINLAWNPSSDSESGVLRYNVWRDNVLVRQPSTTSVADSSLFPSTTYSYEVSAVNGAGLESARTSSVSATTPAAPDATPPTVSITTPFNGAVVNGTLTVNATASDIVGVAGVRFLVDGNQVGTEDTTAPYSRTWNTSTASNGLHVVTVIARDAAGNTASANVTVSVSNSVPADTTPPTVPTNFAVTANTSYQVNLSWNPSLDSDSGVANYRVYRNNVLIGQPLGTSFSDATVGPGAIYLYTVAAVNLVGLFSENSSTLSVATPTLPPPALAITSPVQGSIVTARDVVVTYVELGNLSSVNHTHLQLDSQEVMDFDNDGSYTFSNVGDGSHVLSVWMVRENHTLIGSIVHVNFSVAVPATPPDGGGGGGGGSGGGLQGPKTLKLTYLQIKSGISVEVAKDDKVEATYENNKTYIFTLTRIDSKVVLKYGSQTATFFSGDFSELDLDGDNINELKVVLRSLINGKAVLYFKKIEQTGVTEPPSVKQQQEEQSSSVNQEEQPLIENVRSNGWKILTAAIILLVLVGGVAWFAAWHHQHEVRKIADEFQEQFSA